MEPTYTAYFQAEKQSGFTQLEDAMDWIITQAARFGMPGPEAEAEAKGYAQIFNN